jgi:hypothetical protein
METVILEKTIIKPKAQKWEAPVAGFLSFFGDKMDKVAEGLKRFLSTYDSLRCSCCLPFVCLAKLFCSTKEVSLDRDM